MDARTLLVRGALEGALDRRSQADDAMDHSSGGQDAETDHSTQKPVECIASAYAEQQQSGPSGL